MGKSVVRNVYSAGSLQSTDRSRDNQRPGRWFADAVHFRLIISDQATIEISW
jgi:hypothetical protein